MCNGWIHGKLNPRTLCDCADSQSISCDMTGNPLVIVPLVFAKDALPSGLC